jgi:cyclopropane fatty-acyl-phospholipid synthase-like methyltransferase
MSDLFEKPKSFVSSFFRPTKPNSEKNLDTGSQHLPDQAWESVRSKTEIETNFLALQPKIPWCHYFKLSDDLVTVAPEQERYFGKAKGLKIMARQLLESIPYITRKGNVKDLAVLDLACGEGAHSIELAMAGAKRVMGIEGRKLYVERATFIAKCFGAANAAFLLDDVRKVQVDKVGTFDLVLFYGILHHLAAEDFLPMLELLRQLTSDTVVIFTHTAEDQKNNKFDSRLSDIMTTPDGFSGRLYREHPDNISDEQKEKRVRSSLDNTFSFWAKESSLLDGLSKAGFKHISRQLAPNPFSRAADEFRVFYICRV